MGQSKYLERHNTALKVLYSELLRDLKLINEVPPWCSPVQSQAYWEVFVEQSEVRQNRVDARVINHRTKSVTIEMSCPWIENRSKKDEEKTLKYGPLGWELKAQYKGYTGKSMLSWTCGRWSVDMETYLSQLLGSKSREVLKRRQRSVISSCLNIARTFKVAA